MASSVSQQQDFTPVVQPMAQSTVPVLVGCVKWFNNHKNFGFITVVSEGQYKDSDVFVHQSNIRTATNCFRTLNTNECVQFNLEHSNNDKHPYHAINVVGYNGAQLSCEKYSNNRNGSGHGSGHGSGYAFRGGYSGGGNRNRQQNQESDVATGMNNLNVSDNNEYPPRQQGGQKFQKDRESKASPRVARASNVVNK